jgi:hypothetical protein
MTHLVCYVGINIFQEHTVPIYPTMRFFIAVKNLNLISSHILKLGLLYVYPPETQPSMIILINKKMETTN